MTFKGLRVLTRKLLHKMGFGVWKLRSAEIINFYNYLYVLSRLNGSVTYFQIGAHDGILVDPLRNFIMDNPEIIRGVQIEPDPVQFKELKNNYASFPNIVQLNFAIHNQLEVAKMYRVKKAAISTKTSEWSGITSMQPDHWRKTAGINEVDIEEFEVNCITLVDAIEAGGMGIPDIIIIDTEGYDYQILVDIDLAKYRPKIIRFEHGIASGTMTTKELQILIAKFNAFGYQVIVEQNDATAVENTFIFSVFG